MSIEPRLLAEEHVSTALAISLLAAGAVAVSRFFEKADQASAHEVTQLKLSYLPVYLAATAADWLQGPYVYALYEEYGYTQAENGLLFVFGFGASMLVGTYVGSLADSCGRRKFAQVYAILYAVSCMTKHSSTFSVLIVGRITGGIATSLLYSVFDSWLVSEHSRRKLPEASLGTLFGTAVFGNSIVAISAGVVAQFATDAGGPLRVAHGGDEVPPETRVVDSGEWYVGGKLPAFDLSIVCSLICLLLTARWSENFGAVQSAGASSLSAAIAAVRTDSRIAPVGIGASLFEASMFTFVFHFTPALSPAPLGNVFACFMACAMLGSQLYGVLSARGWSDEKCAQMLFFVSSLSLLTASYVEDRLLRFVCFLVFETCVGIYFPALGAIKGKVVPEHCRAAVYNLFRVPVNLVVCVMFVMDVPTHLALTLASIFLSVGGIELSAIGGNGQSPNSKRDYESVSQTEMASTVGRGTDEVDDAI